MAAIYRLLATRASERPEATAFRVGLDGREVTWRELARNADYWRELTKWRGMPARSRIGLVARDPLVFAAGYLGALSAGMTVVPLDARLTETELADTVARMRVDLMVSDEPRDVGLETWAATTLGPSALTPAANRAWPSDGVPVQPAVLLASSGTTGAPKGIPLSEWQLLHAASRVVRHHRFGPRERGYSPLPLFHVNAQVMGLLATLVSGGSLVLDSRFDANAYWSRVAEWSPTWLNTVPAMLASLAAIPAPSERLVRRIRFARSASAPLPEHTAQRFAEHTGVSILETYGMTEAAGQITANPLDPALRRPGSVGLPIGIGLAVLGPDGHPVEPGEEGMVALLGRQVAQRYLDLSAERPESVRAARNPGGWLLTGDLGRRDEDGFVYLAGRADDVINRGGEKVHPLEIENVLLTHPGVRAAAVVGAPHPRLGETPVAFVIARTGDDHELADSLRWLCERRLARYKRPTVIEVTAELPTGPTGKVLRRALRGAR
jgi:acyl-CoA synthetase (AMP-forming)/AMP-acid ligase II